MKEKLFVVDGVCELRLFSWSPCRVDPPNGERGRERAGEIEEGVRPTEREIGRERERESWGDRGGGETDREGDREREGERELGR